MVRSKDTFADKMIFKNPIRLKGCLPQPYIVHNGWNNYSALATFRLKVITKFKFHQSSTFLITDNCLYCIIHQTQLTRLFLLDRFAWTHGLIGLKMMKLRYISQVSYNISVVVPIAAAILMVSLSCSCKCIRPFRSCVDSRSVDPTITLRHCCLTLYRYFHSYSQIFTFFNFQPHTFPRVNVFHHQS